MFAWTYKDLKCIFLKLAQHHFEFDTSIPLAHQARYITNTNYVMIVKQDVDKLLATKFIKFIEEATWLSIIVIIPKKNGKLIICINFRKLNANYQETSPTLCHSQMKF